MPTFNREKLIARAIHSVIAQTFTNWELIIVDDGSVDQTKEVVLAFDDSRIKYIYQENQERSAARNNGIDHAKGRYICFLDSDDYLLENHLASFYKLIVKEDFPVALIYCNTYEDRNGTLIKFPPPVYQASNNVEFVLLNSIGVPRTCIHKMILERFRFNLNYYMGEDVDLWTRILKHYPLIYNSDYTTVFVSHPDRTVDTIEAAKKNLSIKKEILSNNKEDVSRKVRKRVIGAAWYRLARIYMRTRKTFLFLNALAISVYYHSTWSIKEKLYILLDYFSITRLLLNLFSSGK